MKRQPKSTGSIQGKRIIKYRASKEIDNDLKKQREINEQRKHKFKFKKI